MGKHNSSKRVNQTFSLPSEISAELHMYIKHREMSQFVSDAIKKELEAKKNRLRREYADMKHDMAQKEVIKDWESTIEDGLDSDNEW
jgi:hypothetical protein